MEQDEEQGLCNSSVVEPPHAHVVDGERIHISIAVKLHLNKVMNSFSGSRTGSWSPWTSCSVGRWATNCRGWSLRRSSRRRRGRS